jgi:hypothetical protein
MKTMSLIPKLPTTIIVVLILAIAGAITVAGQTPAENPAVNSVSSVSTDAKGKVVENKKQESATAEPAEKSAEVTQNATGSTVSKKATVFPGMVAPLAPQAVDEDKWQFQFSPYFWLASLHGTGGTAARQAQVDVSFGDIFDALNFAFMATFEARKGKFISLTDVEYVSISDDTATPGPFFSNVDAGFKTFIFDQEVGYRLYENTDSGASIDVLGGVRVWRISTDFEFGAGILPATRIQADRSWVDGVGGFRGKAAVSKKMFVTGKFDIGGGGSKFTWHLFGGAGYSINEKIALIFGYRVLDVNYNKNNFVYDMNQRGPIMGVGFKF